ncbi:Solute carrier family 22 member 16 [Chionoecetes opilio]|uniref:Solute carrier family 22 member 16 n=1 Tax=Chionoecetes opilio TaxID=41210 RepID=A0A8J4XLZ9_CHIOP|nr:Solute carrier family 22 member 16 [Chionoecetes opilio]
MPWLAVYITHWSYFALGMHVPQLITILFIWMVIILAYDAHIRNTENIGPSQFITFTIVGAVKFPADLLTMITLEKLGRRHTTVWSLILSGTVCLVIAMVPPAYSLTVLVLEVAGRFLITMSMNVAQQYPVEVLPTVARAQGSGAIHTMGYLSVFLSPYIIYLSKIGFAVPFVILGLVSIAGGLVSVVLPEILNQDLPDTHVDGETFFTGQSCCYNPCGRWVTGKGMSLLVLEARRSLVVLVLLVSSWSCVVIGNTTIPQTTFPTPWLPCCYGNTILQHGDTVLELPGCCIRLLCCFGDIVKTNRTNSSNNSDPNTAIYVMFKKCFRRRRARNMPTCLSRVTFREDPNTVITLNTKDATSMIVNGETLAVPDPHDLIES